jgi:uncharacterized protein (DUF2141 family)
MLLTAIDRMILTTLAALTTFSLGGVNAATEAAAGSVVVKVTGFRNGKGRARVGIFDRGDGFPEKEAAAVRATAVAIKDGGIEVRFDGLPYGEYAVSMYHDQNGDGQLNKNVFGVPKEGYGVSNNVVHSLRAADFSEARFRLDAPSKLVPIRVHY